MDRAYSTFQIKSVDEAQRIIEGIASTPTLDRGGDVMVPEGAEFSLPMPFLWQHGKDPTVGSVPIGHVVAAHVTAKGINVRIQHAKSETAGRLKDVLDFTWDAIRQRLVKGLSIGWNPLAPPEAIKASLNLRWTKWRWHELSAVTIPMNQEASIVNIKAASSALLGTGGAAQPTTSPAVVGSLRQGATMVPIAEQLTAATAELRTKSARLEELVIKDGADGGLEAAEAQERSTLTTSVETLTARVKSMSAIEAAQLASARPAYKEAPRTDVIQMAQYPRVQMGDGQDQKLPPGIGLAKALMCRMEGIRTGISPLEIAKERCKDYPRVLQFLKEDVPGASTLDNTWASPLVYAQNLTSEFIEFLRPQTIIGRIDGFTRVPFNVRIGTQTSGGSGYWVGELRAKPLTFWGTSAQTLRWHKVANIAVISQELARFSNPSAEAYVRDELARACRERLDIDFIDPDKAAVSNVSPASITNGLTQLNSTATTTLQNVLDELALMMAQFGGWNIVPTHWIMPNNVAMKLSTMLTSLGQPAFPQITSQGGTLLGLPVITSQYLISGTPSNNLVILLSAPEILLADDGGFTIDVSREASLEMNDAPTMSGGSLGSPTGATGSVVVSMFQINAMALRCERFITWLRRRGTTSPGVVWMDDVQWGGAIPS